MAHFLTRSWQPHYQEAERLYFVHGQRGEDPTEPPAPKPFAYPKLSQEPRMLEVLTSSKVGIKALPSADRSSAFQGQHPEQSLHPLQHV